jgi:serine protease inhibitor
MSSESTRDEICIAIGVPPMDELVFLLAHQELHRALSIKKEDVTLTMVNGLFVKGPVMESFRRTCENFFRAPTFELRDKESVNTWVKEQTEGLIESLLNADPTASVFVNVIYFKAVFDVAFPKLKTKCKPFYCDYTAEEPGARTLVPTMHKTETVDFISCHLGKVVELPYGDGTYALLIMLPDQKLGLAACVNLLMAEWTTLRAAMRPMNVEMEVPKFDMKFEFDASEVFKNEDIKEAFVEGSAKLGRLTQDTTCHVQKVVQSAMTTDGDSLYNVKFAEAVRAKAPIDAAPKVVKKKVPPGAKPKPKPIDPPIDERGEVKSEPDVSGDEE